MKLQSIFIQLAMIGALSVSIAACDRPAHGTTPGLDQKKVEEIVRNYLIANPDVVIQSLQAYQQKQMDEARHKIEKTQLVVSKFADALFHNSQNPTIGNPQAKYTIVEFFDYQCPHCVEMYPVLEQLLKTNNDVKIVYKEFPIKGKDSEFAAKAALAANKQGKYSEFHKALMAAMSANQKMSEDLVLQIAKAQGLDVEKLKTDMNSDEIAQQVKANYKLGQDLGLIGTPAFFIAKSTIQNNADVHAIDFIPGRVELTELQAALQKVDQAKS